MPDKKGRNPSSVRKHNRKRVLDIIRNAESSTASQIADRLHLSRTTIWKILDQLQEENLILNRGKDTSLEERGKRPDLYVFNKNFAYLIGLAIFHDHIKGALYNAGLDAFYKEKIPLSPNAPLEEVVSLLAEFIRKWQDPEDRNLMGDACLMGIVIASTGVTDTERGFCFTASRFPSWPDNAPIKELIEQKTELKAPFFIDNYNRYLAFAEKHFGGLENYRNLIDIVTDEEGLGSGVIIDDDIRRGSRFLSGEIGHMRLDPREEETCSCGGRGCFQQKVSSARMVRRAVESRKDHPDSPLARYEEADLNEEAIFAAADRGDEWARELLDEVIYWFAQGIQNINLTLDPDVIVISGVYAGGGEYFLDHLTKEIEQVSLVRMEKKTEIRYSSINDEGPLLGAAYSVIQDYFSDS